MKAQHTLTTTLSCRARERGILRVSGSPLDNVSRIRSALVAHSCCSVATRLRPLRLDAGGSSRHVATASEAFTEHARGGIYINVSALLARALWTLSYFTRESVGTAAALEGARSAATVSVAHMVGRPLIRTHKAPSEAAFRLCRQKCSGSSLHLEPMLCHSSWSFLRR